MNDIKNLSVRILLVEDEETLAIGLEYNLTEEGYKVEWAKDGKEALKLITSKTFDLIILDIMLPYINGFELAEEIRKRFVKLPILILTARTKIEDRIKGLEIGADDYLTKPFHLQEFLLRVKGMLKRKEWYKTDTKELSIYKFGNNEINFDNLECKSGNRKFHLTSHEALVMKYLIKKKGKIVSREELLINVWRLNPGIETRTIDNFISRLRKYFEPFPSNPIYIKSIRSAGYMFVDVVDETG